MSDITLEGLDVSRAVYILSDETQKISDVILSEMDRGVTGIQAKGMYTKTGKMYAIVCGIPQADRLVEGDRYGN